MAEAIAKVNMVGGGVSVDDGRPSRHANYSGYSAVLPGGDGGW